MAKGVNSSDSSELVGTTIVKGGFVEHFEDGYMSCTAIEMLPMEDKCSVLWNESTIRAVPTDLTHIYPMMREEKAAATVPDAPLYVDSGATSHCPPICSNFIELALIEPRSVKGMNGSCISAIGRGKLKP
jgi:hypothetical protein